MGGGGSSPYTIRESHDWMYQDYRARHGSTKENRERERKRKETELREKYRLVRAECVHFRVQKCRLPNDSWMTSNVRNSQKGGKKKETLVRLRMYVRYDPITSRG